MKTLVANQNHPPPECPPDKEERGYHGPNFQERERRRFHEEFDDHENGRDDRFIHTRTARLDFTKFDGDNPAGWTYKVN